MNELTDKNIAFLQLVVMNLASELATIKALNVEILKEITRPQKSTFEELYKAVQANEARYILNQRDIFQAFQEQTFQGPKGPSHIEDYLQ